MKGRFPFGPLVRGQAVPGEDISRVPGQPHFVGVAANLPEPAARQDRRPTVIRLCDEFMAELPLPRPTG